MLQNCERAAASQPVDSERVSETMDAETADITVASDESREVPRRILRMGAEPAFIVLDLRQ